MGFLYCSGAREERAAGSTRGYPWRRRGGGRLDGSGSGEGAWHGRGGSNARQQAGEEEQRAAWAPAHGGVMAGKAGKALHGGAVGGRRREAEQGGEEGDKGDFAISKSSRD